MIPYRKLSLAVLAALYTVGAGTTVATQNANDLKAIEVTDAVKQFNADLQAGRSRSGDNDVNSSKTNTHRNLAMSRKVDFKHEDNLNGEHVYIVELFDEPVARYQGTLKGYEATSPRVSGKSLLTTQQARKVENLTAINQYSNYLKSKQQGVMNLAVAKGIFASDQTVKASYTKAFNGMAVKLNQTQAAELAQLPGVRSVTREKLYSLHTDVGPQHIGADKVWNGTGVDGKFTGEGIVVGILDTGINSDHRAFAAVGDDGVKVNLPARYSSYLGDCAEEGNEGLCNDKLIGVRSYDIITDTYNDVAWLPVEDCLPGQICGSSGTLPIRPENGEDYNGHGSHTASTAAGNVLYNVDYKVPGIEEVSDGTATGLVLPKISGVAPHANVIMYQVCYPGDGSIVGTEYYAGCPSSALLSGIEDAITDGVDIINFSIGSTYGTFPWDDPVEMAFLSAREAGISVSASAGNAFDPAYASQARGAIDHFSPWLTSVAAATHSREFTVAEKYLNAAIAEGTSAVLDELSGAGISSEYTGPIIAAAAYGADHAQCNEKFPANFFAVDPSGTPFSKAPIVVCERGEIARVSKAVNVAAGGAGGFVLYNTGYGEEIVNDAYVIPGIHIDYNAWNGAWPSYYGLKQWLEEGSNHQVTITASTPEIAERVADYIADFSSRGPNLDAPDVMSPNVTAPGVDIYAAYADEMPFTSSPMPTDYIAISGTSMASPHVAGSMALLKQAHPTWTPAQIQSALMTTASLKGVTRADDSYPNGPVQAGYSDGGSGVINVARAMNAGLLLDETIENYRAANPNNGGNIFTLNLPYLYNDNCDRSCSFIRTFTATKAGTWDVEALVLDALGAPYLELEVSPSTFTLAAGETQAISVTAKVKEVQAIGADTSAEQLLGKVTLTPSSAELPTQYLPVGIRLGQNELPDRVSAIIHRDNGHVLLPNLVTETVNEFNGKVNGLVKASVKEFTLQSQPDANRSYGDNGLTAEQITAENGAYVEFFDVPEGTKRIVLDVLDVDLNAYSAIDLGMDLNQDGDIQWNDEALCYSVLDNGDYCAINDPTPGRYWFIVSNYKYEYEDPKNLNDHYKVALAVITNTANENANLEGPEGVVTGGTAYSVKLNHTLSESENGEVYYGLVELGSDAYNTSNLGNLGVKLEHAGDDVTISASQTAAKVGDIIDYHVELAANLTGGDRDVAMNIALPSGLSLIEGSVEVSSATDLTDDTTILENEIALSTTQTSSLDLPRSYVFTTNADDAMCKVPMGENPAFYDLATEFSPMVVPGLPDELVIIPRSVSGLPFVPLYGMDEKFATDYLSISPFGYVQFDIWGHFFNQVYEFNDSYQAYPMTQVAPWWRGDVMMPDYYYDYDLGRYRNVVYAAVNDDYYIFQWDGGQEYRHFLQPNKTPDENSYYSIQSFVSLALDFNAGGYEMVFAYDAIKTSNPQYGSIGLHGYNSELGDFGPVGGWYNDGFAFNDVDEKISEGMVVCADYRGPEQSAINISFKARVTEEAIGTQNSLNVTSQYADSEEVVSSFAISAPSNIQLAAISDITLDENTSSNPISVLYVDTLNTVNTITVEGEHISADVTGDDSGSTFVITPDANWYGETSVTVSVVDKANVNDKASVSFLLTVLSDGEEVTGCTDSSAENYNSDATSNDGSCTYATTEESKKSSSGSFSFLMLLMLSFSMLRRQIRS